MFAAMALAVVVFIANWQDLYWIEIPGAVGDMWWAFFEDGWGYGIAALMFLWGAYRWMSGPPQS
jgi:hypothetical protein